MNRADKLAAIAARVRAGTYQIQAAAIADALIEEVSADTDLTQWDLCVYAMAWGAATDHDGDALGGKPQRAG